MNIQLTKYVPFIFVLLWSTGFVGAKYGLPYAEPFTLLMWRMLFVVPLFFCIVLILKRPPISLKEAAIQMWVGLLLHGFYLGGVFAAINAGIPTGLTSLYVSLSPLVIAIFSGVFLHALISKREWFSLVLGFLGVVTVLYGSSKWEGVITLEGIAWLTFALLSISIGTLVQKKYGLGVGVVRGSMYQFAAALILFIILSFTFETGEVEWNGVLIATLAWMVVALSLASILLLMYMIKHGETTKVASYFYLVPPLAIFEGWLLFDEQWSWLTIVGTLLVIMALILNKTPKEK